MTEGTGHKVERLDYSKRPPGYSEPRENLVYGCWHVDAPVGEVYFTACKPSVEEALKHAWSHYKERHDPPGLTTWSSWSGALTRAAAWTWHDERLALANLLDDQSEVGLAVNELCQGHAWPQILTWPDDQVASVARAV